MPTRHWAQDFTELAPPPRHESVGSVFALVSRGSWIGGKLGNQLVRRFQVIGFLTAFSCALSLGAVEANKTKPKPPPVNANWLNQLSIEGPVQFFETPQEGQTPYIDAIDNAKQSIQMTMFHLTNPAVVTAMVNAVARGVVVEAILDAKNLADQQRPGSPYEDLIQGGVKVTPSSPSFSITHVKAMVVDDITAFITSINLTTEYAETRDYGFITTDKGIISEMDKVFQADLANAKNKTGLTPTLTNSNLVWSPVTSETKLSQLVASAKQSIILTVENLGDKPFQQALLTAAKNHVSVRVITPACDKNSNPLYDFPFLKTLAAGGVETRVMPAPASANQPYMHGKMILVDGERAFIGSVNFSTNSMTEARELGVVFTDTSSLNDINASFEQDWSVAVPASNATPKCS